MPPRTRRTTQPASSTPSTADPTPDEKPTGWAIGNATPSDQYAPVGPDGQPDLSKISSRPVRGMGVQLAVKGAPVTRAVLVSLGKLDADAPAATTNA